MWFGLRLSLTGPMQRLLLCKSLFLTSCNNGRGKNQLIASYSCLCLFAHNKIFFKWLPTQWKAGGENNEVASSKHVALATYRGAGWCGLEDKEHDSGERVCGFNAQPQQSGFFCWLFSSSFSSPWFFSVISVSCVAPLQRCKTTSRGKSYRDRLVTARGYLYEKILAATSEEQKKCNVWGKVNSLKRQLWEANIISNIELICRVEISYLIGGKV